MADTYTASDGSLWHVENICPPIPDRAFDWQAAHDDYDGAPDAHDHRLVYGATRAACVAAVEEWVAERPAHFECRHDRIQIPEAQDEYGRSAQHPMTVRCPDCGDSVRIEVHHG